MALVNPNIALGVQPIQLESPMKMAMAANQLRESQLKSQEYEATAEERNRLRALNPADVDYVNQLMRVSPTQGIAYQKGLREAESARATQQKTQVETMAAKRDMVSSMMRDLSSRPDDENVVSHFRDVQQSPLFTAQEKADLQARTDNLLKIPLDQRGAYLASQGAKPNELSPTVSVGPTGIVQTPRFGGPATVVPGTSAAFQMTPAQLEQAKRDQERLGFESQRIGLEGQRVGLERERVGIARTEAERKAAGGDLKPVPIHAQKAITGAASSISKLTDAIDLLGGLKVAGQEGSATATGIKGYAPDIALNRLDPKGTVTRAAIADIGSMIMHDRSGAAVTASESPRLKPFIPLITDSVDAAKKKLERLRQIQLDEAEALTGTYNPEQGFKPFTAPIKGGKSAAPAAPYSNMSNEELLKQLSGGK